MILELLFFLYLYYLKKNFASWLEYEQNFQIYLFQLIMV